MSLLRNVVQIVRDAVNKPRPYELRLAKGGYLRDFRPHLVDIPYGIGNQLVNNRLLKEMLIAEGKDVSGIPDTSDTSYVFYFPAYKALYLLDPIRARMFLAGADYLAQGLEDQGKRQMAQMFRRDFFGKMWEVDVRLHDYRSADEAFYSIKIPQWVVEHAGMRKGSVIPLYNLEHVLVVTPEKVNSPRQLLENPFERLEERLTKIA